MLREGDWPRHRWRQRQCLQLRPPGHVRVQGTEGNEGIITVGVRGSSANASVGTLLPPVSVSHRCHIIPHNQRAPQLHTHTAHTRTRPHAHPHTHMHASTHAHARAPFVVRYLPPYARGLQQGNSTGTMCSYNSINGVPACSNHWLLTSLVREFWGRPDATHTSDCYAIDFQFTQKHWAASVAGVRQARTQDMLCWRWWRCMGACICFASVGGARVVVGAGLRAGVALVLVSRQQRLCTHARNCRVGAPSRSVVNARDDAGVLKLLLLLLLLLFLF
jgi:hypothetical protein